MSRNNMTHFKAMMTTLNKTNLAMKATGSICPRLSFWSSAKSVEAKKDPKDSPEEDKNGLWEFFENRTSLPYADKDYSANRYGRSWKTDELKLKSFEDLHTLWYVCLRELNVLASQQVECQRLNLPFLGRVRRHTVKLTMARIKTVLTRRDILYWRDWREQEHLKWADWNLGETKKDPKPKKAAVKAKGADADVKAKGADADVKAKGADADVKAKGADADVKAKGADADVKAKGADADAKAKGADTADAVVAATTAENADATTKLKEEMSVRKKQELKNLARGTAKLITEVRVMSNNRVFRKLLRGFYNHVSLFGH